jgi:hypothetical protein
VQIIDCSISSNTIVFYENTTFATPSHTNGHTFPSLFGTRTVLVVRAAFNNARPSITAQDMYGNVFGGFGDNVNLVSQFLACSHGKFGFKPAEGNVLDISVDSDLTDDYTLGAFQVQNAVFAAGYTTRDFDYLIICMPPGSGRSWIAYAYLSSYLSVYNAEFCGSVSTLMHEIGHNLGFQHSSQGSDEYGDESGVMGYSYKIDDGPRMCFNGAKSYATGWYNNCEATSQEEVMVISNVVDLPYSTAFICTIVKFSGEDGGAYYVQYNRRKGFNSGTREGGNKVTVTFAYSMSDPSYLEATLGEGDSFKNISVGKFVTSRVGLDYVYIGFNKTFSGAAAPRCGSLIALVVTLVSFLIAASHS